MAQPESPSRDNPPRSEQSTEVSEEASVKDASRKDLTSGEVPVGRDHRALVVIPQSLLRYELVAKRYHILEFLGSGGMGEVYEAEDLELGEHIALKIIKPEIARDRHAITLFKQEIQLTRKITHPNVCRIFDVGYHQRSSEGPQQTMFFTMELLRGKTLAEQIQEEGCFKTSEALPLIEQIATGLDAA